MAKTKQPPSVQPLSEEDVRRIAHEEIVKYQQARLEGLFALVEVLADHQDLFNPLFNPKKGPDAERT